MERFWSRNDLFPAYAGVILRMIKQTKAQKTFPRLRGGDPDFMSFFFV